MRRKFILQSALILSALLTPQTHAEQDIHINPVSFKTSPGENLFEGGSSSGERKSSGTAKPKKTIEKEIDDMLLFQENNKESHNNKTKPVVHDSTLWKDRLDVNKVIVPRSTGSQNPGMVVYKFIYAYKDFNGKSHTRTESFEVPEGTNKTIIGNKFKEIAKEINIKASGDGWTKLHQMYEDN